MQTKPGCLGAAKSDSSPNPRQKFISFAANPRGSKLKKLYLDSTSTTVGNFDCSISELLSRSMKKLLRRNWPDVMLQNHTAVSSDRNTSVKTVCCFSQRLGGQRSTKLEACWCKMFLRGSKAQDQVVVYQVILIVGKIIQVSPFCVDVFCQHQGFWKPWPTTRHWLSWALQLTAAHMQLQRSWKIWEQIQSNVLACFSSNATMSSCSRVFRLASPYLARSISSNVRMGRVTLSEADWTDFMSCLRNHFWNWFVVSTQDLTLNQLWSWKMLWRIIDVCEASTSLRCLVGALLISKWLWRSMLRAWLHCGNKSQLLSFSQNERRFWRQKHVGNPTVTSDDPGIPLAYWGFAACCALWRGRRTRSGQKTLCLQHRKLHALSIKRMWLCYLPFLFGFFMLTWFLMTCSVFVKTEMQAFVLPKLYNCNRGISMQRDASQEDLMWKMTSKKTKRPPVKPFHSPIQVGYSNQRERCKPMRVTVNLWFLLLSYVHDILQSQKLHRSLVERQVDGTDCIWHAHTIEPCFGCCAKQLNATRPENPWTTFANDKAALTVSWCLRLLLNQVGWEKSMSNVSYSLPERVAVSKHLNCDLDLGAFSGNVSRCWNELEKKSWKEIWQHLWKLNSELQVLRFRAEEFVYEDLASAHCWRTFVHFQLGEPDWGPDGPDHVHCFVKRLYVSLESEMHLRTHHKNMPVQRPPSMICCAFPGKMEFPWWRWLCELSSDPWCTVGSVILCCHASDSGFRYHTRPWSYHS